MTGMHSDTDTLIAELVGDLRPVRPMRFRHGLAQTLFAVVIAVTLVRSWFGIRPDVFSSDPAPVFLIAAGLFFLLGLAASATTIAMSRPSVGNDHGEWKWSAAMVALLPLAAVASGVSRGTSGLTGAAAAGGIACLGAGIGLALLTMVALVIWLRRGAPTSPERAGLFAGVAAGSFGIFAFSFHCDSRDILHIGIWHGGVVLAGALVGRLAVPPLVRW